VSRFVPSVTSPPAQTRNGARSVRVASVSVRRDGRATDAKRPGGGGGGAGGGTARATRALSARARARALSARAESAAAALAGVVRAGAGAGCGAGGVHADAATIAASEVTNHVRRHAPLTRSGERSPRRRHTANGHRVASSTQ
jgi:hypothetical protein